jgi:hypothetical protein
MANAVTMDNTAGKSKTVSHLMAEPILPGG